MKKFKFKDGQVITASSKEEAIQQHKANKVVASEEYIELDKEKLILTKNGFKIKHSKFEGDAGYGEQRMPGHKSVFACISKKKRGTFLVNCYVADTLDSTTDCVYDSDLRDVITTKKTIQEAIKVTRVYFKLVNKMIAIHQKYEEDVWAINKEARSL